MLMQDKCLLNCSRPVWQNFAIYVGFRSFLMQVRAPTEFQGTIIGDLNRRKGVIQGSEGEGDDTIMTAVVRMPQDLCMKPMPDEFGARMPGLSVRTLVMAHWR